MHYVCTYYYALDVASQACFLKYHSPFLMAWSIRLLHPCSTLYLACSATRGPDAPQTKPLAVERGQPGIRHKPQGDACPCQDEKVRGSAALPLDLSLRRCAARSRRLCLPECCAQKTKLVKTCVWRSCARLYNTATLRAPMLCRSAAPRAAQHTVLQRCWPLRFCA
jgi:hypothetical protein